MRETLYARVVQENESTLRRMDSDANADYVLTKLYRDRVETHALHIQNPY